MTEPSPRLFVSIFAYVLGKESDDPAATVRAEIAAGERASWPAFRTLARVRAKVGPVQLSVSHSSAIAKARSVALGEFLASGAAWWLSLDDDIEADAGDVSLILDARAGDVDVLAAPCALRGAARLNVTVEGRPRPRTLGMGVRVFPVVWAGLALSLVSREAAAKLARCYPELRFVDHTDGRTGVGIFCEEVRDGSWLGEDVAACFRAQRLGLRVEALCDTTVTHAGVRAVVDPSFFRSDTLGDVSNPYIRDEPPPPPAPPPRQDAPPQQAPIQMPVIADPPAAMPPIGPGEREAVPPPAGPIPPQRAPSTPPATRPEPREKRK